MAAPRFADYLAERHILRRKLSYWRIATFAALILGVAIASQRLGGEEAVFDGRDARLIAGKPDE
jgi:protease-4